MLSADPIVAVDLHDAKLELARTMGATHTINAGREDARQAVAAALGGIPLDVFIDNTGNPEIIQLGYEITQPQGRVVLVGVPSKGRNVSLHSLPLHFGKSITGSHGGEAVPHVDIPRYHRLYQAGRLPLRELITDRFPLDRINEAIAAMRRGAVRGRCLVTMS
jgi:S-(hydroxymethyl)glutathione dehydrogenase/alcohol dehydrogenase